MSDSYQKVIFLSVQNSEEKLKKITQIARYHFFRQEKLLFLASNDESAQYIDDLLWKMPIESFIIHTISDVQTDDGLVITKKRENINNAYHIFNLTYSPLFDIPLCSLIYELEDQTSLEKKEISEKKYKAYHERKYFIESRSFS
jgi:DNA polymerase IIIc chi subunit